MAGTGRHWSLRTRLLAAMLAVVLVVLVAFDLVAVHLMRGYLVDRLDRTVDIVSRAAVVRLDRVPVGPGNGLSLQGTGYYLAITSSGGAVRPLLGSLTDQQSAPRVPSDLAAIADQGPTTVSSIAGATTYRLEVSMLPARPGQYVVVAVPLTELDATLTRMGRVLGLGTLGAFGVLSGAGWWITRRGLGPLERITETADGISGGDLASRVALEPGSSEVARLANALNSMLARIELSVLERDEAQARVRAFMADASHELRTPLTAVRAYAELYEQGALTEPTAIDQAMHRISTEAVRMSALVGQMLSLARLDEYPVAQTGQVDLTALARDAVFDASSIDPVREVVLDAADDPVVVTGNAGQLEQLVSSLLTNVRVHTPAGVTVTVSVAATAGLATLEVSDDGPGVPAEALPHLFDRFYRAEEARTRPGSGLGLAIVAAIAQAHGGRVEASPNEPTGLRVTITLPPSPSSG